MEVKKIFALMSIISLLSCSEQIMKENSYVVEKSVTTVDVKPIESKLNDTAFNTPANIASSSTQYVFTIPTKQIVDVTVTYPSSYSENFPPESIYYIPSTGVATTYQPSVDYVILYRYGYDTETSWWYDDWDEWIGSGKIWYWGYRTLYVGKYLYGKTIITPTCSTAINDEGYIAPKVVKLADNHYIMWATKYYKQYSSCGSISDPEPTFVYKYNTLFFESFGLWQQKDGSSYSNYFNTFNNNTNTGDLGGIIVSNILKAKITGTSQDVYFGLYLGKSASSGTDSGWKLYSSYALKLPSDDWIRSSSKKLNIALDISPAYFDGVNIGQTSMFCDDDGTYKAYYTGLSKSYSAIGYATSGDGISSYNKYSAQPIFKGSSGKFDEMGVMDPCTIKEDGIYKMYYIGYDGLNYRLGLAYSTDGVNFQYYDTMNYQPINITGNINDDVRYPNVIVDTDASGNRQLRIYYCVKNAATQNLWAIRCVTSN
jgi:hypothetical protein